MQHQWDVTPLKLITNHQNLSYATLESTSLAAVEGTGEGHSETRSIQRSGSVRNIIPKSSCPLNLAISG